MKVAGCRAALSYPLRAEHITL